jgi:hypothetical protein
MRRRCAYPKSARYARYGGRGIRVCERWADSFENFLADMGLCPDGMTLDRKDTNGNYEPDNCRWATRKEQQRNISQNRILVFRGESKTMAEWAEISGLSYKLVNRRINDAKWPVERALTEPVHTNCRARNAS